MIFSLLILILFTLPIYLYLVKVFFEIQARGVSRKLVKSIFPASGLFSFVIFYLFLVLGGLNLLSMVVYRFPATTNLRFNSRLAFVIWAISIFIQRNNYLVVASILPSNSPWYLVPFLRIVELVRVAVRPVTLCFRLLANIRAGHILLTLICKLLFGLWWLGALFGVLELIVSIVQSFVFLMLIGVYLEEAMSH